MSESRPIVDATWLRAHADDPDVAIVELQYEPDVDEYADGHIPGAASWYWKDALWDPLEREFVTPAQAAAWLGSHGIAPTTTLVLYSGRFQYATYGAWVLGTLCGHPDVRVLDGGRRAWSGAGGELTSEQPPARPPVAYAVSRDGRDDSSRAYRAELLARVGDGTVRFVDARYPEEHDGRRVKPGTGLDHGAERHGRIPGAVNLPFNTLLGPDFRLKDAAELQAAFRAAGAAPDQVAEVVAYCRLGHRASLIWFVATNILGWSHIRLYDGSWTEWGSAVGSPVER
jgi:thiosulfate/3-mercaptopyruvate sulfurtransferase